MAERVHFTLVHQGAVHRFDLTVPEDELFRALNGRVFDIAGSDASHLFWNAGSLIKPLKSTSNFLEAMAYAKYKRPSRPRFSMLIRQPPSISPAQQEPSRLFYNMAASADTSTNGSTDSRIEPSFPSSVSIVQLVAANILAAEQRPDATEDTNPINGPQYAELREAFARDPNPNSHARNRLVARLGFTSRQVIWFQHQWNQQRSRAQAQALAAPAVAAMPTQEAPPVADVDESQLNLPDSPQAQPTLNDNGSSVSTCKICLSDDISLTRSAISPCGHVACTGCIKKIVREKVCCPFCRGRVASTLRLYE